MAENDKFVSLFDIIGDNVEIRGIKCKDADFRAEQAAKNADTDSAIEGINQRELAVERNVSSLETRVEALEEGGGGVGDITEISKQVVPLDNLFANRNMIFCCDSYGAHRNDWLQFPDVISNKLDRAHIINISVGGTGFVGGANGTHLTIFQNNEPDFANMFVAAGLPNYSADKVTDIFFGCGHNDNTTNASAIESAITALHNYIKPRYPNATIWVIYAATDMSDPASGETTSDGHTVRYRMFSNVYKPYSESIKNPRCMFIDATGCFSARHSLMRDHTHPNGAGSAVLANVIIGALCGSPYHPKFRARVNIDTSMLSAPSELIIDTAVENGTIRASIIGATFLTFINPITTTGTSVQVRKIGTIADGACLWMIQNATPNQWWPMTFGTVRSAAAKYDNCAIRWNVDYAGNVYVAVEPAQVGMSTDGMKVIYLSQLTPSMDCFA